jgi:hypothetical protein
VAYIRPAEWGEGVTVPGVWGLEELTWAGEIGVPHLIGSAQGQTAIASLLDLRDIAGLLVVASPIETTVDAWSAQAWAVAPSNTLAWEVTPGETAAYVEALTEYVGEFIE